jgi:hypothetical protein
MNESTILTLVSTLKFSMSGLAASPFYLGTSSPNISVRFDVVMRQTFTTKFDGTQNELKWASHSLLLTSKMGSSNVMMKPSVVSGPKKLQQVVTDKQHSMLPAHQMCPLNPALLRTQHRLDPSSVGVVV